MTNNNFKPGISAIPALTNTVIFILLAVLHFYWGFGGRVWYEDVLPTSADGLYRLNPSAAAAFTVGFGLFFLASVTAGNLGLFDRYIKRAYFRYGALVIALVFLLRAIGDFRFFGLFKTIKSTNFAANDTQIFTPICFFISLLSIIIFIFNTNKPIIKIPNENPTRKI